MGGTRIQPTHTTLLDCVHRSDATPGDAYVSLAVTLSRPTGGLGVRNTVRCGCVWFLKSDGLVVKRRNKEEE